MLETWITNDITACKKRHALIHLDIICDLCMWSLATKNRVQLVECNQKDSFRYTQQLISMQFRLLPTECWMNELRESWMKTKRQRVLLPNEWFWLDLWKPLRNGGGHIKNYSLDSIQRLHWMLLLQVVCGMVYDDCYRFSKNLFCVTRSVNGIFSNLLLIH